MAGLASLSACGNGDDNPDLRHGRSLPTRPYELARPTTRSSSPISPDNPPIADGLAPEKGGTFRMLNYADYVNPAVVKAFEEKYDVQVQLTPFNNYDEMLQKLRQPNIYFDIVFPGPSSARQDGLREADPAAEPQLPAPLRATSTPSYHSPWYDVDAQYTVPYTVYSTGIGYRRDRVDQVPENGYDLLWDPQVQGQHLHPRRPRRGDRRCRCCATTSPRTSTPATPR